MQKRRTQHPFVGKINVIEEMIFVVIKQIGRIGATVGFFRQLGRQLGFHVAFNDLCGKSTFVVFHQTLHIYIHFFLNTFHFFAAHFLRNCIRFHFRHHAYAFRFSAFILQKLAITKQ